MAIATPCQTPGAIYHTKVDPLGVEIVVTLPSHVEWTEAEAVALEANLHNAVELAMAPHFATGRVRR